MTLDARDLVFLARDVTKMTEARWSLLSNVMKDDAAMNCVMKEEWHAKLRDSEEAIREYYRESDIWFINTFNHGVGALTALALRMKADLGSWSRAFVDALAAPKARVLDYGGGFFKDTWPMAMAGYRVEVAEVSGPVTQFLKRFIESARLEDKLGVVEVDSATPILGTYDGIACFETLEHLLHPEALAAHLHDHLAVAGPFAFSATFGAPEHAPYHVASNAALGEQGAWDAVLRKIGFAPWWKDPEGSSTKIWRSAR